MKLIEKLNDLYLAPIEEQYNTIQRCYLFFTVFSSKLPKSKHSEAKTETNRLVSLASVNSLSFGEQIALEIESPSPFIKDNYLAFFEAAMYLAGMEEESIPVLKELRAKEVASEEVFKLLIVMTAG